MEKTNGKEAFALTTVETGIQNPGLELTEEGINPEGSKRAEEQGHSLKGGLEPPTRLSCPTAPTKSVVSSGCPIRVTVLTSWEDGGGPYSLSPGQEVSVKHMLACSRRSY